MSLPARLRSLLSAIRKHDRLGAEMDAEFELHMQLRAEDLVRQGMSAAAAARQARIEFGSAETFKDKGREARGLGPFDDLRISTLDLKLGARMLGKYPGLTIIGSLAIAFAIAVGTAAFEGIKQVMFPTLPLPQASAIAALRTTDIASGRRTLLSYGDFARWKRDLTTMSELSAFVGQERNVAMGAGEGEPMPVADVTASAFEVTRVPALLGRTLVPDDERLDAPGVVVIGYELWKSRFAGASDVIGRSIRISGTPATIVGVMPQGYAFPVRHDVWRPLRIDPLASPNTKIGIVFGRLAEGRSMDEAASQAATLSARDAAAFPETHRSLRTQPLPYAKALIDLGTIESLVLGSINVALVLLLALVCCNVALLLFARVATRHTEIVVRTALGASRGRIVMQLFGEALVLSAVGAAIGLAASSYLLGWGRIIVEGQAGVLPFWIHASLSPATVGYALLLTFIAAAIAGVVPALKVTSGGVDARLRAMTSGGGGIRFGGIWTAVIVAQIALTVALPVVTLATRRDLAQTTGVPRGFSSAEYLTATLDMDRPDPSVRGADTSAAGRKARLQARYQALEDRLTAEPGVVGVTYADRMPLMYHPHRIIDMDAGPVGPRHRDWPEGYRVSSASVDPDFFRVIGVPVLSGRTFTTTDAGSGAHTVVVNQAFVRRVMGGANPVGRQLRFTYFEGERRADAKPGPWYEIVGVVPDLGVDGDDFDPKVARIYHPVLPKDLQPLRIAIHTRGDPQRLAPRLRELAAAVDPELRVGDPTALDRVLDPEIAFLTFWYRMLAGFTGIALTLALAGIYAVMAFAVARRTREIGVRVALGASPVRIFAAVFRRPMIQVGMGVAAGGLLIGSLLSLATGAVSARGALYLAAYVAGMTAVCMLACIVPTRRALRIQPTEALKQDG